MENQKIIDKLFSTEWATKKGLATFSMGFYSIVLAVLLACLKSGVNIPALYIVFLPFVAPLLNLIIWFCARKAAYNPNKVYIGLMISSDKNSKRYCKIIEKNLQKTISEYGLDKIFEVKNFPSDYVVESNARAEKLLAQKGLTSLLWGEAFDSGDKQAQPVSSFNIKVSYAYQKNMVVENEFNTQIQDSIRRGSWSCWKPESHFQLQVVTENIYEIALLTLSYCLASVPAPEYRIKAEIVAEHLDSILQKKVVNDNFPNLNDVKKKLKAFRSSCLMSMQIYYLIEEKDYNRAKEFGEKCLRVDPSNINAYINLAKIYWQSGYRGRAEDYLRKAYLLDSDNQLLHLSKAFIHIYRGKYDAGLRQYKRVKDISQTNIILIIQDIENEYETGKNVGFLFASGYLNCLYADKIRGKKHLLQFIEKAPQNKNFKRLLGEADKLVKLN